MSDHFVILCGPIASGKSTIEKYFIELGINCIDVDHITKEVQKPRTACWMELKELLNDDYFDTNGELKRTLVKSLMLTSVYFKMRLESIIHPYVRDSARLAIRQAKSPYCILSIPLLIDKNYWNDALAIIVVKASEKVREQRLIQRDSMTQTLAKKAIAAQPPLADYLALAELTIDTEETPEQIKSKVLKLHDILSLRI
ncbi:MAG: dephospho-CoA kinase [Methylacidiphilales bacterium]|nr:dephospho-CoA kinase [Candidatus Methylacidiphilales bacterium]